MMAQDADWMRELVRGLLQELLDLQKEQPATTGSHHQNIPLLIAIISER